MKEVTELKSENFEQQVRQYLDNNFKWEKVKREIKHRIKNDIEIYPDWDNNNVGIVDIFVPDKAGRYLIKETLECFDFRVDEYEYDNNFEAYIHLSDKLIDVANEHLNRKLDIANADVFFAFAGEFRLQFVVKK